MLFPYNARKETVALHQRWTNDSFLSAVEVYSMVGSPSLFRLRFVLIISSVNYQTIHIYTNLKK